MNHSEITPPEFPPHPRRHLLVRLTIVTAFLDAFLDTNLSRLIALLFVGAMFAFIASLAVFLREIFLAVTGACGTAVLWRSR